MSGTAIHIMGLFFWVMAFSSVSNAIVAAGRPEGDTAIHQTPPAPPSGFQQKLDSLKQADQLEEWLNTWYDYLAVDPKSHFSILTVPFHTIWREPRTAPEKVSWFYLLIFSGYYELQQGNILQSTDRYERAYRLVQNSNAVHDNEILEYLIKPLGNNYTRLGDYERAFFIQKEGLKLAESLNDSMQEAASLANMSTTSRWNDRPEDALRYAGQGLQKVKSGTALQGLLYSTQADILQDMDSVILARSAIQNALHLFDKMPFETGSNSAYWYAGALVTAGDILQKEKEPCKAGEYYQKALHVFQKYFPQSRQREKMKIQVALGQVSLSENNYHQGLQYFNKALTGLLPAYHGNKVWPADTAFYAENTLLDALTGKAELFHLTGKDSLALAGYQKVAIVLQKLRETIFSREAKRLLQEQSLQTTEEAIGLAYQLYKKKGNTLYARIALQLTEQHKARLLLDDLQKNIAYSNIQKEDSLFIKRNRLRQAIAFYAHSYTNAILQNNPSDSLQWKRKMDDSKYELSLITGEVKKKYPGIAWKPIVDVSKIYRYLPEQTVAWEYFTGPRKWYGFAISRQGILQFSCLGTADRLNNKINHFVDHWFSQGPDAMINQPETYFNEGFSIYEKMSLAHLKGYKNLFIIPDGVLGRLPFEALPVDSIYRPDPARWPYLLKEAVTSQSYSLSVWYQLQNDFLQTDHAKGFAGFFINPDKESHLATLEGVRQEEKSIHDIIDGSFYKNKKATAGKLLKAIRENEVIHISTHAFLIGEKQIPALQMADKKIFLADLYPLHAHPALVVISACQTANGLLSPGEGIISLAREFTAAGAGGVIAGLWRINDETVARLTALFYKKLRQSGNKSDALYKAKRTWLANGKFDATLKLPYYWAGLVYYGNNVQLAHPLKAAFSFPLWGWAAVVLLLLFLGWRSKEWLHRKTKHIL